MEVVAKKVAIEPLVLKCRHCGDIAYQEDLYDDKDDGTVTGCCYDCEDVMRRSC